MENLLIDLTIVFNIAGVGQGIVLIVILLRKRGTSLSNLLLTFLLLSFVIIILNTVIILSGYQPYFPFYQDFSNGFILNIGPCIYLFIASFTNAVKRVKDVIVHFIPFSLYFLFNISFHVLDVFPMEVNVVVVNVAFLVLNFQIIGYLARSFWMIYRHTEDLKETFANIEMVSLTWIKGILIVFSFIYFSQIIFRSLEILGFSLPDYITINGILFFSISIFILAYRSLSKPLETEAPPKY